MQVSILGKRTEHPTTSSSSNDFHKRNCSSPLVSYGNPKYVPKEIEKPKGNESFSFITCKPTKGNQPISFVKYSENNLVCSKRRDFGKDVSDYIGMSGRKIPISKSCSDDFSSFLRKNSEKDIKIAGPVHYRGYKPSDVQLCASESGLNGSEHKLAKFERVYPSLVMIRGLIEEFSLIPSEHSKLLKYITGISDGKQTQNFSSFNISDLTTTKRLLMNKQSYVNTGTDIFSRYCSLVIKGDIFSNPSEKDFLEEVKDSKHISHDCFQHIDTKKKIKGHFVVYSDISYVNSNGENFDVLLAAALRSKKELSSTYSHLNEDNIFGFGVLSLNFAQYCYKSLSS